MHAHCSIAPLGSEIWKHLFRKELQVQLGKDFVALWGVARFCLSLFKVENLLPGVPNFVTYIECHFATPSTTDT